jgi:hypothetical protein
MAVGMIGIESNYATQGVEATYTTTSTTMVFTGTGVVFTPVTSGNVKISLSSECNNDTALDGINVNIVYAAGTALTAAGTATAGTAILSSNLTLTETTASDNRFLGLNNFVLTGLTPKTSYTFQPTIEAVTGGTASFTQYNITVEEL